MNSFFSCIFFLLHVVLGSSNVLAASLIEIPPPDETTKWECEEYGIRDLSSFTNFDSRGWLQKSANYGQTVFHGAQYTATTAYKRFSKDLTLLPLPSIDEKTPMRPKPKARGLLVFFHRLNGEPFLWDEHLGKLAVPIQNLT